MLPSKGFFKKSDCPFFEKGLCVRPHCHFRHRKKVLNDNSLNPEVNEVEEDEEAEEAVLRLIAEYKHLSDVEKKPCASTSEGDNSEDKSTHSTLFAKLVNQSNAYEKTNRHIPCAYTPTSQTRKSEIKSKSVSAVAGFADSEKSLELITKARTLLQNYCAENIKKVEGKSTGISENKSEIFDKGKSLSKEDCESADRDENVCDQGKVDDETTTGGGCKAQTEELHAPSEISDKVVIPECFSSKTTSVNKTINEKLSKPSVSVTDVKTEDRSGDVSELDFITSEIEMMKKLLNEDDAEGEGAQSFEEKENKNKDTAEQHEKKTRDSSLSRSHSISSRHKSKSSRTHSSSRSRHSSSHSSRHSRSSSSSSRHRTGSSRRHSSSRSDRSSYHGRSSSRHSREHKKQRHGENGGSESERRKSSSSRPDEVNQEISAETNAKSSSNSDEEEEEEEEDDNDMEIDDSLINHDSAEEEWTVSSRKRRNSLDLDFQVSKYISLDTSEDMEDDPDTVEKECLEIFNNYSNFSDNQFTKVQEINLSSAEYENTIHARKRTAHSSSVMSDHSALRHKTVKKSRNIKSAQELMLERYKIAEKARKVEVKVCQPTPTPIIGLNRPIVRIAAVSNIQQMLLAKKKIQEKISQGIKVNERTTIAQTVTQGASRVAHVPKLSDMKDKPTIMDGSKQVPRLKRQTYMEKLFVETSKIYPTKGEAAEEALKLEQEIFKLHSGSTAAYHAAFVSLLMKTRRRVASVKGETPNVNTSKPKVSHFDILSGGKKNFSVIKTKKVDISMLTDKQIYMELLRCKLTPEELKENGFPMSSDRQGYATCTLNLGLKYNEKYQYIKKITGNRRYCIRCSKLYDVDPVTLKQCIEGPDTCSYHPGRKKSGGRNCERIYNCCNTASTEGCVSHIRHVTDSNDYENYPNCVRTLEKEGSFWVKCLLYVEQFGGSQPCETDAGVYALDCEMVYTRLGSELARVTVVNLKKEIVYDTLVKPKYPVECYNTFYSGIEEKMLEGVETTLKDVQAVLLSIFSNKTILIGHSLDSDLRALHLIHDTVVDTSIVYKNEKYFPYKYSLKDLCARKISKIIQDNVNGHDSSEDAIAALEIMLQHVKEEVAKYDSLESYEADRGR